MVKSIQRKKVGNRNVEYTGHPDELTDDEEIENAIYHGNYIPMSLRPINIKNDYEEMYAIGDDDGKGGFGMWEGPNSSQLEMLDVIGRTNDSYIFHFKKDGTSEIKWRWSERGQRWIYQRGEGEE
jgi:hypothetical protein